MDEGENGRVRFSIEEGNLYNYFSIDPQSGNIFLNIYNEKLLRDMHRGCHVIKINVKDLGKPVQQSFGWVGVKSFIVWRLIKKATITLRFSVSSG